MLAVVERGVEFRVVGRTLDDAPARPSTREPSARSAYPGGRELDLLAVAGDRRW